MSVKSPGIHIHTHKKSLQGVNGKQLEDVAVNDNTNANRISMADTAKAVIEMVADLVAKKLDFSIQITLEGKKLQFTSGPTDCVANENSLAAGSWEDAVKRGGEGE